MVANWIFEEHLRPFMETLAHFAGTVFEDDDWIALEYQLLLRDEPAGLTYEPGTSVVSFKSRLITTSSFEPTR